MADTNFPVVGKSFEVENFQLLTMIFSENFRSVETFLAWEWVFRNEKENNTEFHVEIQNRAWMAMSTIN